MMHLQGKILCVSLISVCFEETKGVYDHWKLFVFIRILIENLACNGEPPHPPNSTAEECDKCTLQLAQPDS